MPSANGVLALLRPANVATALADVLAGYAIAGLSNHRALPWLLVATACLYAGGVVFNDFFDRELDRIERPERPIPSGRVPARTAAALGAALLVSGIAAGSQATTAAAGIAVAIAALVLVYDTWGKKSPLIGPVNMGLCRALNLLLGAAAVPASLADGWPIALIPLAYIMAVTALSRGEVHGGRRGAAGFALISLSAALAGAAILAFRSGYRLVAVVVFVCLIARVVPPFVRASVSAEPGLIRIAVKQGVLSLVLLNAVIGTAYAGPAYGAAILVTGLLAGWLARRFAVT